MMRPVLAALAALALAASGASASATAPAAVASAAAAPAATPVATPAAAPIAAPATATDGAALSAPASAPGTAPVIAAVPATVPVEPRAGGAVTAPANAAVVPAYNPGPSAGSLMQTIFALLLVLALLAALAWVMKRYGPKASGASAHLRIVGALNLGGRERVIVVEIGDQWVVVGAAPGRVNALATMPKQEGAALAVTDGPTGKQYAPAATFADWLKQTIDNRNASNRPPQ